MISNTVIYECPSKDCKEIFIMPGDHKFSALNDLLKNHYEEQHTSRLV